MNTNLKLLTTWIVCLGLRLAPFRPANVEPVLASTMPAAKRYGPIAGFLFSVTAMVIYDMMTSGIGIWTWVTAATYGLLSIAAALFFRNRAGSSLNFVGFSVISTLVYDAVTGLGMGPLLFHQTFAQAYIGQIPFTISHLVGNALLAALVSPLLYRWMESVEPASVPAANEKPLTV